ncbi:hypothetical protein D8S78_24305 [Natrialba swarupiae]|nr:hypothetical protein [Natrialba swarupiae]
MTTSVLAASSASRTTVQLRTHSSPATSLATSLGGLVGENFHGTIEDSSTTTDVDGNSDVGGLVGQNSYGEIRGPQPPAMSTVTIERAVSSGGAKTAHRGPPSLAMLTVSTPLAASSA